MGLGTDDNKESVKVKESGGESLLEAKKQLLEELEVGSIFKNKTSVDNNVDDFDTNVGVSGSLKGFGESVRRSLKFELIDDTVLIEPVSETETANGGANVAERNGKKNGKQGTDGKKEKRPRRRGKVATRGLETSEGQKKVTQVGEAQNRTIHVGEIRDRCATDGDQMKRKYSRVEMEALRFANIVEQRKLWRDVYTGLGYDVVEGYKDLASSKHQKNVCLNFNPFNPLEPFGRKEPGILGEESSENVDDGLENMEGDGVQNVDLLNPACSSSIEGEGAATLLVEEYDEEDDSDDDYASIQRPAFAVEGEPDFDSGPPEDGLEYLRRVRWEAAHIPKVKVAKLDRSRVNKEQTVYMPQIPDIAKCPEYLLPSRQWEDVFLADFSELRLLFSQNDGPSTKISHKMQPAAIVHGSCSPQLSESVIVEKFNNLRTDEVQSYKQPDTSSSESIIDQLCMENREDRRSLTPSQHQTPEASSSDALCNYPTLPVILAMDSVARVSMLRRCIKLAETTDALSKNDCVWLFALCAAVDAPLDAGTCAALRGLLRKCASLRAGKSELDDEVIMLNILATISGRYFGQSES
uniref:Gem-associated protein 2 n=1 Tax=Populus trichocarpa TaxID=3694 RepID=A0A3N7F943_POPTR